MTTRSEATDALYGISVRDFGARGDGVSDDSESIQRALDAGKDLVVIPVGSYKIGKTLRVPSNTRVKAHPSAHLFLADHAGVDGSVYLLTNSDHDRGNANIRVEGGLWDGNNRANPRGPDIDGSYTGVLVDFCNVKGFEFRDVTLLNPESYFVRLGLVVNFTIEKVRFRVSDQRPNQDGIHVGGLCEHGDIRDITAAGRSCTNDDIVALLSDDNPNRAQNFGVKFGPIRDIRIQHLRAEDCHTFVRLLSVFAPIEDVTIQDVVGGCRVCALNVDASRYCMKPVFDPNDPKYKCDIGMLNRIRIRDVAVHRSWAGHPNPLLLLETKMNDFSIENFTRDLRLDADPGCPTMRIAYVNQPGTIVEGMSPEQARLTQAASAVSGARIAGQVGPDAQPRMRGVFDIKATDKLVIPEGGFERMHA